MATKNKKKFSFPRSGFFCVLFGSMVASAQTMGPPRPMLRLVKAYETPVITVDTPGAGHNKYGFEGGRAVKIGKTYHLITTESAEDPRYVKTRIGYWTSEDRVHWKRVSTLFESTANETGKDIRASLWGPMPIFNDKDDRWELFYVGYLAAPESSKYPPDFAPEDLNPHLEIPDAAHRSPHIFYAYQGTVIRAVSQKTGMNGIGGPYKDAGVILKPGPQSQPWEGIQGTDSFFAYKVKDKWYGFYGSCHCETTPIKAWEVGLASASDLAGPWTRLPEGNPIRMDKHFVENPIVTQLKDGTYIAVYNGPNHEAFGYATSQDGVHWSDGVDLVIQPKAGQSWSNPVRTPLGLIPEDDGTFTIFYTGFPKGTGDLFTAAVSASVSFVTVKLDYGK